MLKIKMSKEVFKADEASWKSQCNDWYGFCHVIRCCSETCIVLNSTAWIWYWRRTKKVDKNWTKTLMTGVLYQMTQTHSFLYWYALKELKIRFVIQLIIFLLRNVKFKTAKLGELGVMGIILKGRIEILWQ